MGSARPHRDPGGMTDQGLDATTTDAATEAAATTTDATPTDAKADRYARGPNGLLLDPDAARREERHGWLLLTGIFIGGGILVVLASLLA
jgi:hypothetical protein